MVELRDGVYECETGTGGAFAVIVVSLGPAEIGHHSVTEVLADVATITGDRFARGAMISGDQLTPFFGI